MNMTTRITVALVAVLGLVIQAHAQKPAPVPAQPDNGTPPAQPDNGTPPVQPLPVDKVPAVSPEPHVPEGCSSEPYWVSADLLLAWVRSVSLPPLVTTSPPGTPRTAAGVLGQPGTRVLFGNRNANGDLGLGFQLGGGAWLDEARTFGVDAGFLMRESRDTLFFASSPGTPILARPFFDVTTGLQSSQLIAFPGVSSGSVAVSARADNLYGVHVDFQEVFLECNNYRIASILGYHFLQFNDGLGVQQTLTTAPGSVFVTGTQIQTQDRFAGENDFHGLDLGLRADFVRDTLSLGLLAKVAVGMTSRSVVINGNTRILVPGTAPLTFPGGFLALVSNIGRHKSTDWDVLPELGLTAGWEVTHNVRLRLGYSVLFWPEVARAADQVSLRINPNQFPPPQITANPTTPPVFELHRSNFWVQSLTLGLEYRF
jgi:hypothetical protein